MGTGARSNLAQAKNVPGPGNYNPASKAIEGPKFGMGLKLDNRSTIGMSVAKTKGNPGAGTYDADYKKAKKGMPSYTIKGRYLDPTKLTVPGPGAYNRPDATNSPDRKRGATHKIGTGQRGTDNRTLAPGPG